MFFNLIKEVPPPLQCCTGISGGVDLLVFENINIVPNISMESTSNSALINGAIHNLGIAILPEMYVQTYLESGKLLKLDVENVDFLLK